jgi:hypothetical protein
MVPTLGMAIITGTRSRATKMVRSSVRPQQDRSRDGAGCEQDVDGLAALVGNSQGVVPALHAQVLDADADSLCDT